VNASGWATTSWPLIHSAHGESLAQVIRLRGSAGEPAGVLPARRASRIPTACGSSNADAGAVFREPAGPGPRRIRPPARRPQRGDRRDDRHRHAGGQPGPAPHARPDGPHRHSDDRRVQLAGGIAEAPDLLRGRRALQRVAGQDRAAGQRRHHHPRRDGPAARRLPEVSPGVRGRRRAGRAIMFIHTAGRPGGRVPAGPRPLPGGRRAVRAAGQARPGAADRHDRLRRRAEGNLHRHGADPVQPRLSRRPVHPDGRRYEKAVDFDTPAR
jgi:hypothetical protein